MKIERSPSVIDCNSQERIESDKTDTYEPKQETLPPVFRYPGSQGSEYQGEKHHAGETEP
jgi:hypothetical protein